MCLVLKNFLLEYLAVRIVYELLIALRTQMKKINQLIRKLGGGKVDSELLLSFPAVLEVCHILEAFTECRT